MTSLSPAEQAALRPLAPTREVYGKPPLPIEILAAGGPKALAKWLRKGTLHWTAAVVMFVFTQFALTGDSSIWQPSPQTTWQWQLQGTINQSVQAEMFDVDLFDTPSSTVTSLHAQGRKVICYVSAGSWENWRPDAGSFPASVLGNNNGWPGEKWLDIRRLDILGPIMEARLDLCRSKGFDGVEPDNVDGYTNNSGFPLTAQDQLRYNQFLAEAAHARGLSVGLKNDLDQVAALVPFFDWAMNEECFRYRECSLLKPFIDAGKAVFHVEYQGKTANFCPKASALGFMSMKKRLSLNAWREVCW